MKPTVLFVDDEVKNLEAFIAAFRRYYTIFTATNAQEAQSILASNEIQVLITDQRMPGTLGTTLLEYAVGHYPQLVRILVSAHSDYTSLLHAVQKGYIIDFIEKPWTVDDFKQRIDYACSVYFGNMAEEHKRILNLELSKQIEDELKRLLENDKK